ncbi:MAG: hypothetical protein M3R44_02660 [Candidatus Eremiobacteraeota bacterium]|nr:hypothetical protein [Candidatus Eremiobacteraeota bacterium]
MVDKPGMRYVSYVTLLALLATAGCANADSFMPKLRAALDESHSASLALSHSTALALARARSETLSRATSLAGSLHAAPSAANPSTGQAVAVQPSIAPETLGSGPVDMSGVLRDAVRLPQDVQRLREAIVTGLIIISVLGFVNILLMVAVLSGLRRIGGARDHDEAHVVSITPATSIDTSPVTPARTEPLPPKATTLVYRPAGSTVPPVRTCACGTEISARSKTGRCRACARTATARAQRAARTPDVPVHA